MNDQPLSGQKLKQAIGFSLLFHGLAFAFVFGIRSAQDLKTPALHMSVGLVSLKKSENKPLSKKLPHPHSGTRKKKQEIAASTATVSTKRNGLLKADGIDLRPRFQASAEMGDTQGGALSAMEWKLRASDQGSQVLERGSWKARVKRDGSVAFEDKVPLPRIEFDKSTFKVSLPFDLTELAMRLKGEALDAPQKKRFLNETRVARDQMAQDTSNDRLVQAIFDIRSRLTAIWENNQLSIPEKKRQFFALWDECDESESESLGSVSALIRASIMSFVARELPAKSEHAYSEEELSMLNRNRQSRVLFQPYEMSAS